jgi:hypothetical protein
MTDPIGLEAAAAIAAYRAAQQRAAASPCRDGQCVRLTAENATRIVIGGDIHGRSAMLERLLELAQLELSTKHHLVLQEICHGGPTYPDGGCRSHQVLQRAAELIGRFPGQVHLLLSNHELSELTEFPICKGRKLLNLCFRAGFRSAFAARHEEVYRAAMGLLAACPLAVQFERKLFVSHSLPDAVDSSQFDLGVLSRPWNARDLNCGGEVFRMVWGRDLRSENADAFADAVGVQWLITAHQPLLQGVCAVGQRLVILNAWGEPASGLVFDPNSIQSLSDIINSQVQLSSVGP